MRLFLSEAGITGHQQRPKSSDELIWSSSYQNRAFIYQESHSKKSLLIGQKFLRVTRFKLLRKQTHYMKWLLSPVIFMRDWDMCRHVWSHKQMVFRLKPAFEAHVINDFKLIKMRNSFMDFVGDSARWTQLWFDSNHNQCFCYFPGAALRIFLFPNSLEQINEKRADFLRVVMLNLF